MGSKPKSKDKTSQLLCVLYIVLRNGNMDFAEEGNQPVKIIEDLNGTGSGEEQHRTQGLNVSGWGNRPQRLRE